MSAGFRAVQWNRALYIGAYLTLVYWLDPPKDLPAAIDLRIRAFGTCAFFMLTIILSIGPLARLDHRFLPLLYNRRHFGVLIFFVALLHAGFLVLEMFLWTKPAGRRAFGTDAEFARALGRGRVP